MSNEFIKASGIKGVDSGATVVAIEVVSPLTTTKNDDLVCLWKGLESTIVEAIGVEGFVFKGIEAGNGSGQMEWDSLFLDSNKAHTSAIFDEGKVTLGLIKVGYRRVVAGAVAKMDQVLGGSWEGKWLRGVKHIPLTIPFSHHQLQPHLVKSGLAGEAITAIKKVRGQQ